MCGVLAILGHVPSFGQSKRNSFQDMDSLRNKIYVLQKNNVSIKDSLFRTKYATCFKKLRNYDNYFMVAPDTAVLFVKDYVANDGCYMTIYWWNKVRNYMFKKICSNCSSLIFQDGFKAEKEMELLNKWNFKDISKLTLSRGKNGITQVFRIMRVGKVDLNLEMYTYSGFYFF